jgi:hypothetical protein
VNQGGEAGRDEYGLPRVDIQIPDDARELYRDVQAYHRELRAIRRQDRGRRWRAPLRRTGVVAPLIAGCLVLAMVASMILTMFSANPYFSGIAGQNPGAARANGGGRQTAGAPKPASSALRPGTPSPAASGAPAQAAPLPDKTITVAGRALSLHALTSTALAMIPAGCRCSALVGQLVSQARAAGVTMFLVGTRGSLPELKRLAPRGSAGTVILAVDPRGVLDATYRPVGLSVLLVGASGSVRVTASLGAGFQLEPDLRQLKTAP